MKALSLRQPFASLMLHETKRFETRSWALRRSMWGVKLALHASKTYDAADQYCTNELMRWTQLQPVLLGDLPLGMVLGVFVVEACYRTHEIVDRLSELEQAQGNYQPGRAAWKVKIVDVFDKPVPAKGKLGLWEWELSA